MKTLKEYILFEDNKDEFDKRDIKFTIWEKPDKKVSKLKDNESYQKIEYKIEDFDKDMYIDFLLGFEDGNWKLWIGKIGSCSYDDDPYCSLDTKDFEDAILKVLDIIPEFVDKVKKDPHNYIQYYKYL